MINFQRIDQPGLLSKPDVAIFIVIALIFGVDAWRLLDAVVTVSSSSVPGIAIDRGVVAFGIAALIALALHAYRVTRLSPAHTIVLGGICGFMFFSRSLGCALIDPGNIQWLLRGDWAEHYASWASYRSAPWSWPPGVNANVWYPVGTSIVFTDSLPLFAIPAKIFRAWLPETFQYIGMALAMNFTLHGVFAALLVRRATNSTAATMAGCMLFLFAPVLIWRIGHDTLTAQWIVLAASWLYFREDEMRSATRETAPWCALALIASLTHPYFPPMIMAIALAYWIRRVWIDHARSMRVASAAIVVMAIIIVSAWWVSGAFLIRSHDAAGGVAMGIYTSNLLTFFNSGGFSNVVPAIAGVPGEQWEGAAYFGLGILCLIPILLIHAIVCRRVQTSLHAQWPLFIAALITALFAVSTTVMLGSIKLTQWHIRLPLIESYRASGRFIWVAFYVCLIVIVWKTPRAFPRFGIWLLVGALALQMYDFRTIHLYFAGLRSGNGWPSPTPLLVDSRWDAKMARHAHLTLLPPVACGKQAGSYLPFQLLAARHAATVNTGYLARWDVAATEHYCADLQSDIEAARYSVDELYVVGPDMIDSTSHVAGLTCEVLDSFTVCEYHAQQTDNS